MITHLTWVLGRELPPHIDQAIVTCHAVDDMSIESLIDTITASMGSRSALIRLCGTDRWKPTWGSVLHVYVNNSILLNDDFKTAINKMIDDGPRLGVVVIMYS